MNNAGRRAGGNTSELLGADQREDQVDEKADNHEAGQGVKQLQADHELHPGREASQHLARRGQKVMSIQFLHANNNGDKHHLASVKMEMKEVLALYKKRKDGRVKHGARRSWSSDPDSSQHCWIRKLLSI